MNSIQLNDKPVAFNYLDLSYLELNKWDNIYLNSVRNAPVVTVNNYREVINSNNFKEVKIIYTSFENSHNSFVRIANLFGAMDNIKANVITIILIL